MRSFHAGILIAHQVIDYRREFRFQRTFISVFCTVFSLLNTFQQRVLSSSEIIFEFEPRSVKHSRAATARVGVGFSKLRDGLCEFRPEASTFQAFMSLVSSGIVFHTPTTKMIPRSAGLSPPYRISNTQAGAQIPSRNTLVRARTDSAGCTDCQSSRFEYCSTSCTPTVNIIRKCSSHLPKRTITYPMQAPCPDSQSTRRSRLCSCSRR